MLTKLTLARPLTRSLPLTLTLTVTPILTLAPNLTPSPSPSSHPRPKPNQLMDKPVGLEDLKAAFPEMGRSLQALLASP